MTRTTHPLLRLCLVSILAVLCLGMEDTTGCESESSANVEQERIHTAYWFVYDAEGDTSHGRAQFRLGSAVGTTLLLAEGASARFEERSMGFDALLDWHDATFAGFVPGGRFTYTDLEGNTFVNAAPEPAPVEVPDDFPATLARDGSSIELFWDGPPLAPGESMEVVAAHDANRFEFVRSDVRAVGAESVVLSGGQLADLPRGGTVLTLRRWWETQDVEAPEGGGVLRTTYQSREAYFTLD